MIRFILCLLLLTGCTTTSSPVQAEKSERLNVEIPVGWAAAISRTVGDIQVAEYYPPGSSQEWEQKISVEALSGTDLPDPLIFTEGMAEQQSRVCNRFSVNPVFAGFENGYASSVQMLQCGDNKRTGKDVVTVVKAIRGNDSFYTVTRIWRLDPAPPPLAPETINLDQNELAAWSYTLRNVLVCDPALEEHPCPEPDAQENPDP
ncbi:MAG: hypothetical protein NXH95_10470 [Pseudomonadaceae bacterium]|nr:hypothetical protein [Pseudomonadaceae bacterium]